MRKAYIVVPLIFGVFALAVIVIIAILVGREAMKVDRKASIEDVIQQQKEQKAAEPVQQTTALQAVRKALESHRITFVKGKGWHSASLLSSEWDSEKTTLWIWYYTEADEEPTEFFIITYPKRAMDLVLGDARSKPLIEGLGGFMQPYPTAKGSYAVGQRLISGFNVIHMITLITEDADSEYLTFDPELKEAESDRNYLFVPRADAAVERLSLPKAK
jgi:hypothetical protein